MTETDLERKVVLKVQLIYPSPLPHLPDLPKSRLTGATDVTPHPPTKKQKQKKKEFYLKTQANLTEMFFVFYVLYVGMHDLSGD